MKTSVGLIMAILIAGVSIWGYGASQAPQMGPPALQKIAVVNVTKVLTECKENLDRQKLTEEKRQLLLEELKKLEAEANAIKAALDANVFKPGTKEHQDQWLKYYEKIYMIEATQKGQEQAFEGEIQAWMETLYKKALTEIAHIAQQEGFSLVLNNDETGIKLENMIYNRKVLYRLTELDLTDRVLKNLDGAYEKIKQSRESTNLP